jgi:hypothetical protein
MNAVHQRPRSTLVRLAFPAAVVAAIASFAPSAYGQTTGAPSVADTPRCTLAPTDTAIGPLYGALHLEHSARVVPEGLFDRVLAKLAVALANDTLELAPVQMLSTIVITGPPSLRPEPRLELLPWWPGHPALAGEMHFTITPSGALTDAKVRGRGDTSVARALIRAVERADALGQSRPSVPVTVRLRLSLDPDSAAGSIPLVAARQITTRLQDREMHARASRPPLPPPRSGRSRSTTVRVFVWYEVDDRGRVIPRTIGATSAAKPDESKRYDVFANDVMDSARHWKHDPAAVGECAASWRVLVPVWFNVAY